VHTHPSPLQQSCQCTLQLAQRSRLARPCALYCRLQWGRRRSCPCAAHAACGAGGGDGGMVAEALGL